MLNKRDSIQAMASLACGFLISLGLFSVASASGGARGGAGGSHGGGGSHMGGGAHVSGPGHFGGVGRPGGGYGRYSGGGYRGGWRGYRGGYGGYGFGFGAGLAVGLYFSTLPLYCSTFWWGGIPYYYADDTFYTWDGSVGQYQTVEPPPEVEQQAESQAITELMAYPKNGQSEEQQARDKADCRQWATTQSGYSPEGAATVADPNRGNYLRAEAACLDARGYSVT